MRNIMKVAREEVAKLEGMIRKIDKFLASAPEGCLKWQNKNGKTYYYHQYMIEGVETKIDDKNGDREYRKNKENTENKESKENKENKENLDICKREYIKKDNIFLAKALAQKQYYMALRPILEKNLYELNKFIKRYQKENADNVYEMLSIERKRLVTPLQVSVNEQVRRWREETYEKNNMYPENLRYETEQGELVRSKSEVIIANILHKHRKDILYKYERPLPLIVDGSEKTVYPDFTIINIHTGKIVYWEHAGRMDDSHYAGEFVKKMNAYVVNNLSVGRDVVLTFEAQGSPLDIGIVRKIVEMIVE